MAEFLLANPEKTVKGIAIACFGSTFKPDIYDLRESPILEITKFVTKMHLGKVLVVEPNIESLPTTIQSNAELSGVEYALNVADIVLLLVDHIEFKQFKSPKMEGKVVVDIRGLHLNKLVC